jgi:hypothetical protein
MNQGHEGKIYRASNWIYVGTTGHEAGIMLNGKLIHRRTINSKYGTSDIGWLRNQIDPLAHRYEGKPKYKYRYRSMIRSENESSYYQNLMKAGRKQRHRCARQPVWRGRGSTERGAPMSGHIKLDRMKF